MLTYGLYEDGMSYKATKIYAKLIEFGESTARKMLIPRAAGEYKNARSQKSSIDASIKRYGRSYKTVIENDQVYLVKTI